MKLRILPHSQNLHMKIQFSPSHAQWEKLLEECGNDKIIKIMNYDSYFIKCARIAYDLLENNVLD